MAQTCILCCVKLYHQVSVGLHLDNVTPLGVVLVDDGAVPGAWALVQDIHVEAVQMDRVS